MTTSVWKDKSPIFKKLNTNKNPSFISMVLDDTHLSNNAKLEFINEFWNKYQIDSNFRKEVIGSYLFFYNNSYYGIISSVKDTIPIGNSKDDKYLIQIY